MPDSIDQSRLDALAHRFAGFGATECVPSSPLYAHLSAEIATDRELLTLAAHARQGQPVPNLLFAAVQFLLVKEPTQPLTAFYPTLSNAPPPGTDPYPLFRAFCLDHRSAISELLRTRLVQTNEVRRCACLLPAFVQVARRNPGRPLALVEIGPSAGLNLLWDRYGYDYGNGLRFGDLAAPVQLTCELRGDRTPSLAAPPTVTFRIGVDLNPVDVRDPDATLWLRALIWPEHHARVQRLQAALTMAQQAPPTLLAGNALDELPTLLPDVPTDATLCVYHSHVVNQFSPEDRERFDRLLADSAHKRPVFRVSMEGKSVSHSHLELITYDRDRREETLLATYEAHGRWLEWKADDTPLKTPEPRA